MSKSVSKLPKLNAYRCAHNLLDTFLFMKIQHEQEIRMSELYPCHHEILHSIKKFSFDTFHRYRSDTELPTSNLNIYTINALIALILTVRH